VVREIVSEGAIAGRFASEFSGGGSIGILFGNETYNSICLRIDIAQDPNHAFSLAGSAFRAQTVLPANLVREVISLRLKPISDICKTTRVDYIISGAPPGRDQAIVKEQYRKKSISDVWIADPETCLGCWKIQSVLMAEIANENDSIFIRVPDALLDEDGFLHPQYIYDGVHGNQAYNEAMLAHILQSAAKGSMERLVG
jgi:hypothetical protein